MRTLISSLACAAVLVVAVTPAGASPDGGRAQASTTKQQVTSSPVVRELHTVIRERDAGRTLSTVLAGAALLVASGAAAYSIVAVRRSRLSTQS